MMSGVCLKSSLIFVPRWSDTNVTRPTMAHPVRHAVTMLSGKSRNSSLWWEKWKIKKMSYRLTMSYLIVTLQPSPKSFWWTQDGQYVTVGHCRKECLGTLPVVPFAAPKASEPPPEGWLSGLGADYSRNAMNFTDRVHMFTVFMLQYLHLHS